MIAPQTNIRLLNTPLENDRANSLTWNTVEEQTNYFLSKTVFSYPEATYTRKGQFLRIPKNVDQLYNCNYVMYKNYGHSNKWFYAFIERIEYVNDDVSYIYIVPDELQTWYFEIEFKDSFVVREHTNNDTIGANRTEENIGIGGYVTNKKQDMYSHTPNVRVLLPYSKEFEGEGVNITGANRNLSAYKVAQEIPITGPLGVLNALLTSYMDKGILDKLGAMYLVPYIANHDSTTGPVTKATTSFTPTGTLNGYTPKNKKLLCYPYTIIKVHNASDSSRVLMPELFSSYYNMGFAYWCDKMPNCRVSAVPTNYGGVAEAMEYGINSAPYPLCSASFDGFQNYIGLHGAEYNISVASRLADGALNIASGIDFRGSDYKPAETMMARVASGTGLGGQKAYTNYMTQNYQSLNNAGVYLNPRKILSGATEIASTLAEADAKQKEAYHTIGSLSNNNLNASGNLNIYIEQQTVTSDYAKRIDDYFSMYGYKTNLLKVPNLTGRRNWNYIETKQCNIIGEIPNESIDDIRALFDNGVTLWHNPATYLDYSQDNSII